MLPNGEDVSVIICAYTEKRWEKLREAVASVQRQTVQPREIIIVIDYSPILLKQVKEHIPNVIVVENTKARGLRGARNCGVAIAQGQIIAFLDDDAVAIPDWLKLLCQGYANVDVLGTGGGVIPSWEGSKPAWLSEEFYWVIGCSYRGMPENSVTIRNPIGANMSMRREVFVVAGDFHSENVHLSKQHAGGCEETEICIRAHQYWPQRFFLYHPSAIVFHHVPQARVSWRYFFFRCYSEGLSKAILVHYVGAKDGLVSERTYTYKTLPHAILQGLKDTLFRRDLTGLARAGAIIAGLAVTTAGYLVGRISVKVMHTSEHMDMNAVGA